MTTSSRRALLVLSVASLAGGGLYQYAFMGSPHHDATPDEIRWYPPASEVKPHWSTVVNKETRWVGVSDDGDAIYWVESNSGKHGSGRLHLIHQGQVKRSSFTPIDCRLCEAGDVSGEIVAIGVLDSDAHGSHVLLFNRRDLKPIAQIPFPETTYIGAVRILTPTQILVGYEKGIWSSARPLKACLVELGGGNQSRTELVDNSKGISQEQIGGGLYFGVSSNGRRFGISRWRARERHVLDVWNASPLKRVATIEMPVESEMPESPPTFTPDGGTFFWGPTLYRLDDSGRGDTEPAAFPEHGMAISRFLVPFGVVGYRESLGAGVVRRLYVPHRGPLKIFDDEKSWTWYAAMSTDGAFLALLMDEAKGRWIDVWKVGDFIAKPTRVEAAP